MSLIPQVIHMVHDKLGHNGTHRTYILLKRLYYWKGLKPSVEKHIKRCHQCQRRNKQVVKYAKHNFDVATFSMQFISMDLIGEFHPPTSKKHRYALTVICMLTGYVFCVPLKTKTAEACIAKHVMPQVEWDALVPLACAVYNFIPNEHSKESPFFLMF